MVVETNLDCGPVMSLEDALQILPIWVLSEASTDVPEPHSLLLGKSLIRRPQPPLAPRLHRHAQMSLLYWFRFIVKLVAWVSVLILI